MVFILSFLIRKLISLCIRGSRTIKQTETNISESDFEFRCFESKLKWNWILWIHTFLSCYIIFVITLYIFSYIMWTFSIKNYNILCTNKTQFLAIKTVFYSYAARIFLYLSTLLRFKHIPNILCTNFFCI